MEAARDGLALPEQTDLWEVEAGVFPSSLYPQPCFVARRLAPFPCECKTDALQIGGRLEIEARPFADDLPGEIDGAAQR